MKKTLVTLLTAALVAILPLAATAAQDHDSHARKMDQETHTSVDYGDAHMNMVIIGEQSVDGVMAMAHLNDVRAATAEMKMKETHHMMLLFMDEASGEPIDTGTAAVKITDPSGKEGDAVRLVVMNGHFGADIELMGPGEYHFTIGTKLADGKKRQFDFDFRLK